MRVVTDSSIVLAILLKEVAAEDLPPELRQSAISCINISEILTSAEDKGGVPVELSYDLVRRLELIPYAFDEEQALRAAMLRPRTRHRGLGIGDRACLALAQHLNLPVITRDRLWDGLDLGIDIRLIR